MKFAALLGALVRRRSVLALSYRSSLLFSLVGSLTELCLLLFLGRWIDQRGTQDAVAGGYFGFASLGTVAVNLATQIASGGPQQLREGQLTGEAEVLFLAPWRPLTVLCAVASSHVPLALARFGFELGLAWLLGARWHVDVGLLLVAVACLVLGAIAFSLLGMAFVLRFKRGDPVSWGLGVAALLLSGIWFPREVLPAPLRLLGELLFTTPALELLRAAMGSGQGDVVAATTMSVCCGAISWGVALLGLAYAIKLGKSRGGLVQY